MDSRYYCASRCTGAPLLLGAGVVTLLAVLCPQTSAASFSIEHWVMSSGAVGGVGTDVTIWSCLGEAVTGTATSPTYELRSGFRFGSSPGTPVGSPASGAEAPITRVALRSVRPNPTGRGTQIELAVPPGEDRVAVRIFDATGRLVRELADGSWRHGIHVVAWDGQDVHGATAPAGVYFVSLDAASARHVRKLVVLR